MLKRKRKMYVKKGIALLTAICMFFSVPVSLPVLAKEDSNLTGFESRSGGDVVAEGNAVTLSKSDGDHFAMYTGSDQKLTEFTFEADVQLEDGNSAALIFGADNDNPGGNHWYAANFNNDDAGNTLRVFCVGNNAHGGVSNHASRSKDNVGLNLKEALHMSISVNNDGAFIYRIKNIDSDNEIKLKGKLDCWEGGHVGLLTFCSKAEFSNITLSDEYKEDVINTKPLDNEAGLLNTNLEGLKIGEGTDSWEITEEGLHGWGTGDNFILSESKGTDFVYEADVTFKEERGAASLVFRSDNKDNPKNSYVANINGESGEARLFKFQNNDGITLVKSMKVDKAESYHLKVVAIDKHIVYFVNDVLVANTGDYVLSPGDTLGGQNTAISDGCYGLLSWEADAVYQNVYYTEIKNDNSPLLKDLQLSASEGEVEAPNAFKSYQYSYLQYVDYETRSAEILPTLVNEDTEIIITDRNGTVTDNTVSLEEGENLFTVTASHKITNQDSQEETEATVVYRYFIHRRAAADSYYYEPYRGQYHYSVKDGWANDPNGMVFYNGEWHLFYQFYNDTNWGPMHWAHAVSKDLIHWEEKPITFYPDEYGTMYSGCAVVDEDNTSGLFGDSEEGGLVALITAHGNGERVIVAYSQDGKNWEKTDDVAIDWTEDPLKNRDFRDPKVFRYQNKWFMVIAGGPLRIYSSENLREWTVESTYPNLHMECPDLYRLPYETEGGSVYKWVLSRGGREYKVGDFKEVAGKWTFVPDDEYKDSNGKMNFGKDSYAAMTYYYNSYDDVQPRVIEINWMNNWDYCNSVDDASNNERFNGTFNLQLELSLTKDSDGKYLLKQTPIEEYKELRDEEQTYSFKNVKIKPGENILKDYTGDSYEIIATFQPEEDVKEFGFYVRKGEKDKTEIKYNRETKKLSVDRRESGLSPGPQFSQEYIQDIVVEDDGEITLHIFVDRASVEVFGQDYTMACALQIFPEMGSNGIEVFSRGGVTQADITLHYLDNIWGLDTETEGDTPRYISISKKNATLYKNEELELKAYVSPEKASQEVTWSTENEDLIKLTKTASGVTVKALGTGTAIVTAESAGKLGLKTSCQIIIRENNVATNLEGWKSTSGEWYADGDYYYGNDGGNAFMYSGEKTKHTEYSYETDVEFEAGVVNIIFASGTTNPFEGCYSVQLVDKKVRLFDFREDFTFSEKTNDLEIPDDNIYRVKITVTKNEQNQNIINVKVNGTEYIDYTVTDESRIYDNGYFALGIYDTNAKFRNIFCNKIENKGEPGKNTGGNTTNNPETPENPKKEPVAPLELPVLKKEDGTQVTVVEEKGEYDFTSTKVEGDLEISANGAVIKNLELDSGSELIIKGKNVVIADSAIKGTVSIPGGMTKTVTLNRITASKLVVEKAADNSTKRVSLNISRNSSIDKLYINAGAKVQITKDAITQAATTAKYAALKYAIGNMYISVPEKALVTLYGDYNKITLSSKKANVKLMEGKINRLTVKTAAANPNLTLAKGTSITTLTVTPKAASETLVYKSSNKKIVAVSQKGKVKAVKKGKTTITVTNSNGKSIKCKITVN